MTAGEDWAPASLDSVRVLVGRAHADQVDKLGRNYIASHLEPIAESLVEHGEDAVMAGLLHDILEDTAVTPDQLLAAGVPPRVVKAVESVSKRAGESYDDLIERARADPLGRLVKLADNAWNLASNAALAQTDPENAARLRRKYEHARLQLLKGIM